MKAETSASVMILRYITDFSVIEEYYTSVGICGASLLPAYCSAVT